MKPTSICADSIEIAYGITEFLLCLGVADQEFNWLRRVLVGGWNSVELFLGEFQLSIPLYTKQLGHVVGEVVDSALNVSDLVDPQAKNAVGRFGDRSLPRNGPMLSCKMKTNQSNQIK